MYIFSCLHFTNFVNYDQLSFVLCEVLSRVVKMSKRAGPDHPLYKSYPNQIAEIRKSYGFEDVKKLDEAIDMLDAWAKQQNHFIVRDFDRDYLESYVIMAKGSLEKAKKRLDKRCTMRNMYPELFDNIQVKTDFENLQVSFRHACMPTPTRDYTRVSVDKFMRGLEKFNFIDYGRLMYVTSEYTIMNDYTSALEGIVDFREVTAAEILTKFNPLILQKIMIMFIEGYGARLKAIHIICQSKVVDVLVTVLKQGMSEKMGKRLQLHNSPESLHKFIEKECLPSDYGGTGPSIEELHERFFNELTSEKHIARMKVVDEYATDETKRLSGVYNEEYLGMPGSFKSLTVD